MKKRIISLFLAVVILFGVVTMGAFPAAAVSEWKASDECVRFIKEFEGFSQYPYWDYQQYTVGYGSTCPNDKYTYYKENGITHEEAEVLLREHLVKIEAELNSFIDKYQLTLSQNQFDALVDFSYNCGTKWLYESGTLRSAVVSGATGNEFIHPISLWCNAGGSILIALINRRLCEANMYLNGVYDSTPPENYGYVLYDAAGGSATPRVQGFDTTLTAQIISTAERSGYTFDGWFNSKTGGTQVTLLDASVRNTRLYAHWTALPGTQQPTESTGVTVKVTATKVNLRQGPGTNYSVVGMANPGDTFVITETAEGSGYTWGKFDGGWIVLKFTDYSTAVNQKPVDPPATEPTEPTVPETTAPTEPTPTEPTVPETTAPTEPTVPETTAPTEPTPTEPVQPAKTMGTVKVSGWLNVRSGAGTGYPVAGKLYNGDRVEILEQKTVGSVTWGRVSKGWISMDYVTLDKVETPTQKPSTDNTGSGSDQGTSGSVWTGYVINTNSLRIRTGPGTNYSIAGYLTMNTKVTITEMKTNGSMIWGKISNGWISLDYVRLDSNGDSSEVLTGRVNYDFLRIRTGPGTSYAIAGFLDKGDKVEILERRNVGSTVWGRIDRGWISLDYIDLDSNGVSGGNTSTGDSDATNTKVVKTVTADCLRVRRDAGTGSTIVGYLYQGAKVEILETKTVGSTLWGRVSNGWISMDYAK